KKATTPPTSQLQNTIPIPSPRVIERFHTPLESQLTATEPQKLPANNSSAMVKSAGSKITAAHVRSTRTTAPRSAASARARSIADSSVGYSNTLSVIGPPAARLAPSDLLPRAGTPQLRLTPARQIAHH